MENKEIRDFIIKYLFIDGKENDKITISLTGCIRICEAYYNYKNKTKQNFNKNRNKEIKNCIFCEKSGCYGACIYTKKSEK